MKQQATTIALCLACGLGLHALNAPLPFLFGSLGGCLIGALLGMHLKGIPICSTISRTILGVAIGTSLSWALVLQIPNHLTTLMLIPIYVIVIGALGIPYFYKVFHYDLPTAFYAAMPGGLQDMVIFGIESGANPRSLSLIHATLGRESGWSLIFCHSPSTNSPPVRADRSHPISPPTWCRGNTPTAETADSLKND